MILIKLLFKYNFVLNLNWHIQLVIIVLRVKIVFLGDLATCANDIYLCNGQSQISPDKYNIFIFLICVFLIVHFLWEFNFKNSRKKVYFLFSHCA